MKLFKYFSLILFTLILATLWGCSGGSDSNTNKTGKLTPKLVGDEIQVSLASDDQANPRTVYMADKKLYFVTWDDYRNRDTSGADIYGKFIDAAGAACGGEFLISKDAGGALAGNQTLPDVAYRQESGMLLVAWQDSIGTANSGFLGYTNITNIPTSTTCSTVTPTVDSTPSVVGFTQMQRFDGSSYKFHTATISIESGGSTGTAVHADALGSTEIILPGSVYITGSYKNTIVASDGTSSTSDNIVIGLDDFNGKISGSGLLGGTVNYNNHNISATLSLVSDNAATLDVTYWTYRGGGSDIGDALQSRKSPRVNYDSVNKDFLISWVESRSITNFASVRCFGAPITGYFGDSNFIGYMRIANDGKTPKVNGLGVTGPDIIRSEAESGARTLSNLLTAHYFEGLDEVYEFEFYSEVNNPVISSDPTSPETLMVWEGAKSKEKLVCTLDKPNKTITAKWTLTKNNSIHIYGVFEKQLLQSPVLAKWIDFENSGACAPGTGEDPPPCPVGTNPSVSVDDTSTPRKFLVAWEDMRGGSNTKIFGQLINSGGSLYNGNRMLSYQDSAGSGSNDSVITNSRQTRPIVSYDAVNQRYFVMWQDERNGSVSKANIDLYGQYVNLDGSLSGTNYAISSNPSNQLAPAIAYDSFTKQFLAVWKDARNITDGTTASDIYGQRFAIGQPQMTLLTTTSELLVPAVYDFKTTTGTWSFVVKNTGDMDLNIDAIKEANLPSPPFSIAPSNGTKLAPGSSVTYTITYNPTSSGVYNDSFTLTSDGGSQKVALSATGNVSTAFSFSPVDSTALSGTYSVPFSQKMTVVGGYAPFTWSLDTTSDLAEMVAAGFTVNSKTGEISWPVPIARTQPYSVKVKVTDSRSPSVSITNSYTLKISSISVTNSTLDPWTQWVAATSTSTAARTYSQQLTATGGSSLSYVWSLVSGSTLPTGLNLSSSGLLSGNLTDIGTYYFSVLAQDSSNVSAPKELNISISPRPVILTESLASGLLGSEYSQVINMTGGTEPLWSNLSGLPVGLVFNTASCPSMICGTPTSSGTYNLTFRVSDITGASYSKTLSLVINSTASPTVTGISPSTGTTAGGSTVTITGTKFTGATAVTIGGTAVTSFVVNSDTSITATTPAGTAGVKDVSVGTGTGSGLFTYQNPTITGISPTSGATAGGNNVTITGTNFTGATSVKIGGTAVTSFVVNSDTSITATTPAGTAGVKDVAVGTGNGSSLFTYVVTAGGSVSTSNPKKTGCFIATAAFGSYLDPHVMVLRHFRDDVLLQSRMGTSFVDFYYKHSPPIADFIAQHDTLRMLFRFALTPLIFAVKYPLAAALLFVIAGVWFVRRRISLKQAIVVQEVA